MANAYPFNRFFPSERDRGANDKRRQAARLMVAGRTGMPTDSIMLAVFVSWQGKCTLPGYGLQRRGTGMSCQDSLTPVLGRSPIKDVEDDTREARICLATNECLFNGS